jgi:transmembrane sensor
MNPLPENPEERLDDEAADWLCERADGFTPGLEAAFRAWCKANARAEAAFALFEEMPAIKHELPPLAAPRAAVVRLRRHAWIPGLAAALVVGLLVWRSDMVLPTQRFEAPLTEPCRIALVDGSVVDLNAGSRIEVRLSGSERRVRLRAGEAHFQVAHDPQHAFIVTANDVDVRAVGTAFDVRLSSERVEVLVTQGRVQLNRPATSADQPAHLIAGERTTVTPASAAPVAIETVPVDVTRQLLSWQNRMTSFTDVPLCEMIERINRCNTTQFVLADDSLADRRIGGFIALNQIEAFVRLLDQDGITADRASDGRIVLRRARP